MKNVICICTRGRVENEYTLSKLSKYIDKTLISCHSCEKEALKQLFPDALDIIENDYLIGKKRHDAILYAKEKLGAENILFMDDNLRFSNFALYKWNERGVYANNVKMKEEEIIDKYIERVFRYLEMGYGLVGCMFAGSSVFGKDEDEYWPGRMFGTYGLNIEKYTSTEYTFDKTDCHEDFYVQIGMVMSKIDIKTINDICFNKVKGANAKGGCSTFRSLEVIEKASKMLVDTFPNYVKFRLKKAYKNMDEDKMQLSVEVYFKKLYKDFIENNKLMIEPELKMEYERHRAGNFIPLF